ATRSSRTSSCCGATRNDCSASPQLPVKQMYRAITVANVVGDVFQTRASVWKNVPPAPGSDAAAGSVILDSGIAAASSPVTKIGSCERLSMTAAYAWIRASPDAETMQ